MQVVTVLQKMYVCCTKHLGRPDCEILCHDVFLQLYSFVLFKGGGETDFRPVVDYRALNKKIVIESVPLPDIHSCFHWFAGATMFSTLDLNSAYNRIPIGLASLARKVSPVYGVCYGLEPV
jgi:hypothetical protein